MTEQFVLVESYGRKIAVYGFWPTRQDVALAVRRATARSKAKNSAVRHSETVFKGLKVRVTNDASKPSEEPAANAFEQDDIDTDEYQILSMELAPVELDNPPAQEFDALIGNDQYRTDMETVRAHLERGTFPMSGKRFWGGLEWAVARLTGMEYVGELPYPQPLEEDLRGRHTVAVYERTRSLTDIGFKHRWQARLFSWLVRRSTTEHSAVVGS